jgi:hypothetical protein
MTRAQRRAAEQQWLSLLLAEWHRRRLKCESDMEAARRDGELAAYRRHRARWRKFWGPDQPAYPPQ